MSDPLVLDCEVSLDGELFDPAVRDELATFFARALHSDYRRRFDNAEERVRAWRRIFESVDRAATETDDGTPCDLEQALAAATEDTPQGLQRARARWDRQPWMTALRDDVATLFDKSGGVMTAGELAAAVQAVPQPEGDSPMALDRILRLAAAASQTAALVEAAPALEARITRAVQEHRFLLLTVAPRHLLRAEEEIGRRFSVARISLEAQLIQAMKTTATAVGARWEVVLRADAALPQSADWRQLQNLVRRAIPTRKQRHSQSILRTGTMLLFQKAPVTCHK